MLGMFNKDMKDRVFVFYQIRSIVCVDICDFVEHQVTFHDELMQEKFHQEKNKLIRQTKQCHYLFLWL